MTRKHFKALAEALKASKPDDSGKDNVGYNYALATWNYTVNEVAGVCGKFNPQFDTEKFYSACGVT